MICLWCVSDDWRFRDAGIIGKASDRFESQGKAEVAAHAIAWSRVIFIVMCLLL